MNDTSEPNDLALAFGVLSDFLADNSLTTQIADAERALVDSTATTAASVIAEHGMTSDLLEAALAVRSKVGRLNDVIHAATISLVLPQILEPGERVTNRPSLAAGNDPSRLFDLETDRRIAEFKVAQWKGADTMRKRGVFADLVHLALDQTDRRAQLFVVGPLPEHFLRASASKVSWALDRSSARLQAKFIDRFGTPGEMTVADFTSTHGAQIEMVDLCRFVPELG